MKTQLLKTRNLVHNTFLKSCFFGALAFTFIGAAGLAGAVTTVNLGSAEGHCGDTVKVPVRSSSSTPVGAFGLSLQYDDSALTFLGVDSGEDTGAWASVDGNESTPGVVTLGGFRGAAAPVSGSAELAVVSFLVEDCPATVSLTATNLVDDLAGAQAVSGEVSALDFDETEGPCGGLVYLPVKVWQVEAMSAFGMTLEYDSDLLMYRKTEAGEDTQDWASVNGNETAPGSVRIGGFRGAGAVLKGKAEVAVLTFQCKVCPSVSVVDAVELVDDAAGKDVTVRNPVCKPAAGVHSADTDGDQQLELPDLLRVIQFFNSGSYHCNDKGEDGFGPGAGDTFCNRHAADYEGDDFEVDLSELLRQIQLYSADQGNYHPCFNGEDGFCPGQDS